MATTDSQTTDEPWLRERPPAEREAYLEGARYAFRLAAAGLDLKPQDIRLAAGEVSAQGMRDVLAVLGWRRRVLEDMANAI
jgi:hypothetical protein